MTIMQFRDLLDTFVKPLTAFDCGESSSHVRGLAAAVLGLSRIQQPSYYSLIPGKGGRRS